VFRRWKRCFRETGSVVPVIVVNAGRPRTLQTPICEDAIIADVERKPCNPHDIARELGLFQPRVVEVRIDDLNPYNDSRNARLLLGGCSQHLLYMPLRSPHGLISLYSASFYSGLLSRNVYVLGHMLRNVLYLFFKEESQCVELLREFLLILYNCAPMSLRVHLCAMLVI